MESESLEGFAASDWNIIGRRRYLVDYVQLPGIPSFRKLTIDLQLTYFIVCEF